MFLKKITAHVNLSISVITKDYKIRITKIIFQMKTHFKSSLLVAILLSFSFWAEATIIFVKHGCNAACDGTSWATAYTNLQDAIDEAAQNPNPTQIWVAAGIYKPNNPMGYYGGFEVNDDMEIYGGFAGNEDPATFNLDDRDLETNKTILHGDIADDDIVDGDGIVNTADDIQGNDNIDVILYCVNLSSASIFDGFLTTGGYNSDPTAAGGGGGIRISGGGGNFDDGPIFKNILVIGNYGTLGGGVINKGDKPKWINCRFIGNRSHAEGGGFWTNYTVEMVNCLFSGNRVTFATGSGGGIYGTGHSFFTNCTFSGNNAGTGGGFYANTRFSTIENCIFWGNSSEIEGSYGTNEITVKNSIVQGGYIGPNAQNVLDIDPLFLSLPDFNNAPMNEGDLHLTACSPALNIGDNAAPLLVGIIEDLDRNDRFYSNGTIDLGAYEYQGVFSAAPALAETHLEDICPQGNSGSIDLTVNSNTPTFTVDWLHILGTDNPEDVSDLSAGTYEVFVTDYNVCTSSLTVEIETGLDTEKPSISCPDYPVYATDPGSCFSNIIFPLATAEDNCGIESIEAKIRKIAPQIGSWSSWTSNPSGAFTTGTFEIKWRAKDASNNKKTCLRTFEITDQEMPNALCQDLTISLNGGSTTITPQQIDNGSTDNCGIQSLSLSQSSFNCNHLGNQIVTLTVSDQAGNENTCTATITVDGSQISINDLSHNEGNGSGFTFYFFQVSRLGADCAGSIDYTTQDGTATLTNNDYVQANGTLYWPPGGSAIRYAIVRAVKDNVAENDETFTLKLSNPSTGFSILKDVGIATVVNDDAVQIQGNKPSNTAPLGNFNYQIAPNPASSHIHILTNFFPEGGKIKLYNGNGVVVKKQKLLNTSEKINISDLPAGIYFLHLTEGGRTISQKVIIE